MRKYITISLIFLAAAIYLWDVFLIVRPDKGPSAIFEERNNAELLIEQLIAESNPVQFVEKGRSPFLSRITKENPIQPKAAIVKKLLRVQEDTLKAPDVKVTGLIWNQNAPIAMITLPDGSSGIAKPGDSFSDITVKKIEKNRILVTFQKKDFWITR
jgi:hypothetical protein